MANCNPINVNTLKKLIFSLFPNWNPQRATVYANLNENEEENYFTKYQKYNKIKPQELKELLISSENRVLRKLAQVATVLSISKFNELKDDSMKN
jgi:hypothetical protein